MENEERLVKTCIGLVSEHTLMCLADRAVEIAIESDITIDEALIILLKLASRGVDTWYKSGKGWYLDFGYKYDYFVVNKWFEDTEIACIYNDKYNVVYSLKNQKYYKEYAANEYADEIIKEEIDI